MTDPKVLWQAQAPAAPAMSPEELRAAARRFHGRIRRRNLIEYAACVVVILAFGTMALGLQAPLKRTGAGLVVLGTLVIAWQLHVRGGAMDPDGALDTLTFHRRELARQRNALASVWLWYLAPMVPGLLMLVASRWIERGDALGAAVQFAVMAALFSGIAYLNRRGARRLQTMIDALAVDDGEEKDE